MLTDEQIIKIFSDEPYMMAAARRIEVLVQKRERERFMLEVDSCKGCNIFIADMCYSHVVPDTRGDEEADRVPE